MLLLLADLFVKAFWLRNSERTFLIFESSCYKSKDIPLIALPKATTSKHAARRVLHNAERQAQKLYIPNLQDVLVW